MVFLLAGNAKQADEYILAKKLRKENVRMVDSIKSIRGIIKHSILAVGSWRDRPDIDKLSTEMQKRELSIAEDKTWP